MEAKNAAIEAKDAAIDQTQRAQTSGRADDSENIELKTCSFE